MYNNNVNTEHNYIKSINREKANELYKLMIHQNLVVKDLKEHKFVMYSGDFKVTGTEIFFWNNNICYPTNGLLGF